MTRHSAHRRAGRRERAAPPCAPCQPSCRSSLPWRGLAAVCLLLALLTAGSHASMQGQLQRHSAELAAAQQLYLQDLLSERYMWAEYADDEPAGLSQEEQDTLALLELLDTPGFWASTWNAAKSKVQGMAAATEGAYDAARVRLLDAQIAAARKRKDTATVARLTEERTRYVQSYSQNQKAKLVAAQRVADNKATAKAAAKQYGRELAQGAKDLAVAGSTVVKVGYNAYQINSRSDRLWELEKAGKGQSPEAVRLRAEILAASRAMSNNEKIQRERMASAQKNVPTLLNSGKSVALGTLGIGDVIVGGVKTGASSLSVAAATNQLAALQKAGVKATDPRMVAAQRALASANAQASAAKKQVGAGVVGVQQHGEAVVRTAAMANPVLAVGVAAYDVANAGKDSVTHAMNGDYKAAALAAGRGTLHAATARLSAAKIQTTMGTARAAAAAKQTALQSAAKQASAKSTAAATKAATARRVASQAAAKEQALQTKLTAARQQLAQAQAKAKSSPTQGAKASVKKAQREVLAAQTALARAKATSAGQFKAADLAQQHAEKQHLAAAAAKGSLAKQIAPKDINFHNAHKHAGPNPMPLKQRAVVEAQHLAKKQAVKAGVAPLQTLENRAVAERAAAQQQAAAVAAQQRQTQLLQAQARQRALQLAAAKKKL